MRIFGFEVTMAISMEIALKTKYPQKSISDGPSAILRPLYNSNMAKVSIVKSSQNYICELAYPKFFKKHEKLFFFFSFFR